MHQKGLICLLLRTTSSNKVSASGALLWTPLGTLPQTYACTPLHAWPSHEHSLPKVNFMIPSHCGRGHIKLTALSKSHKKPYENWRQWGKKLPLIFVNIRTVISNSISLASKITKIRVPKLFHSSQCQNYGFYCNGNF